MMMAAAAAASNWPCKEEEVAVEAGVGGGGVDNRARSGAPHSSSTAPYSAPKARAGGHLLSLTQSGSTTRRGSKDSSTSGSSPSQQPRPARPLTERGQSMDGAIASSAEVASLPRKQRWSLFFPRASRAPSDASTSAIPPPAPVARSQSLARSSQSKQQPTNSPTATNPTPSIVEVSPPSQPLASVKRLSMTSFFGQSSKSTAPTDAGRKRRPPPSLATPVSASESNCESDSRHDLEAQAVLARNTLHNSYIGRVDVSRLNIPATSRSGESSADVPGLGVDGVDSTLGDSTLLLRYALEADRMDGIRRPAAIIASRVFATDVDHGVGESLQTDESAVVSTLSVDISSATVTSHSALERFKSLDEETLERLATVTAALEAGADEEADLKEVALDAPSVSRQFSMPELLTRRTSPFSGISHSTRPPPPPIAPAAGPFHAEPVFGLTPQPPSLQRCETNASPRTVGSPAAVRDWRNPSSLYRDSNTLRASLPPMHLSSEFTDLLETESYDCDTETLTSDSDKPTPKQRPIPFSSPSLYSLSLETPTPPLSSASSTPLSSAGPTPPPASSTPPSAAPSPAHTLAPPPPTPSTTATSSSSPLHHPQPQRSVRWADERGRALEVHHDFGDYMDRVLALRELRIHELVLRRRAEEIGALMGVGVAVYGGGAGGTAGAGSAGGVGKGMMMLGLPVYSTPYSFG
ncbi:hypothetical protein DFJ73DRAFT_378722 [Zopfochytrium polystomum]|nr:hypothetical protein DFJ73DRAFT_378722 [Zopfochytrium polystomum]